METQSQDFAFNMKTEDLEKVRAQIKHLPASSMIVSSSPTVSQGGSLSPGSPKNVKLFLKNKESGRSKTTATGIPGFIGTSDLVGHKRRKHAVESDNDGGFNQQLLRFGETKRTTTAGISDEISHQKSTEGGNQPPTSISDQRATINGNEMTDEPPMQRQQSKTVDRRAKNSGIGGDQNNQPQKSQRRRNIDSIF